MHELNNKVVVITGASSGIGAAVAKHLASLGANVVLGARRADRLEKLATEIGDTAIWKVTDVTKKADMEALAGYAIERFGAVDALINNAGIMPISLLANDMVDDWERMIDINVKGVLYGIHAVLNHMLGRGEGAIINIASTAAHSVGPGGAVYSATKSAVRTISEGLRQEVSGVLRVCTISPGFTESELAESVNDESVKPMVTQLFEQKAMPASAIAEAVAYVLGQPKEVAVNEITVRPLVGQSS